MTTIDKIERIESTGNYHVNNPDDNTPISVKELEAKEIDRIYSLMFGE
jgi:hypothetical protein